MNSEQQAVAREQEQQMQILILPLLQAQQCQQEVQVTPRQPGEGTSSRLTAARQLLLRSSNTSDHTRQPKSYDGARDIKLIHNLPIDLDKSGEGRGSYQERFPYLD